MKKRLTALLAGTAIFAALFSACGTRESETPLGPVSGDLVVGVMSSLYGRSLSRSLIRDYSDIAGVSAEIVEFVSDRDMIDAARKGEIDLALGNDLVNLILAHEGSLADLEPVLGKRVGTGEYYDDVIEAGRIGGKLLIAIPHFQIEESSEVALPTALLAKGDPGTMEGMAALLSGADEMRISDEVIFPCPLIEPSIDWEKGTIDMKRLLPAYGTMVRAVDWSRVTGVPVDPWDQEGSGYSYVPLPVQDGAGFAISTVSGTIPRNAAHPEAALAFVDWIFSEKGQNLICTGNGDNGYPVGCPVLKSASRIWSDRWFPGKSAEIERTAEHIAASAMLLPLSQTLRNSMIVFTNFCKNGKAGWEGWKENILARSMSTEDEAERAYPHAYEILIRTAERMEEEEPGGWNDGGMKKAFYEEGAGEGWASRWERFLCDYFSDLGYPLRAASE